MGHKANLITAYNSSRFYRGPVVEASTLHKHEIARSSNIQRYYDGTLPWSDNEVIKGVWSQSGAYFLPGQAFQSGRNVWARTAPSWCDIKTGVPAYTGGAWYKPKNDFIDDCLHTAEEIINGQFLFFPKSEEEKGDTYSREKITKRVFGQGDKANVEIGRKAREKKGTQVDRNADARLGEAFVIVDLDFARLNEEKRSPYHAGGVIGVDGSDRVTMEVFASGDAPGERDTPSTLSMYTVGDARSFHDMWVGRYFTKYDMTTIVIKPK